MPTAAQITANQANSQFSTGPQTEEGKAASSQNRFRHGLIGQFAVLAHENATLFDTLRDELTAEHQPATITESMLVDRMAQHHWLSQRALTLQNTCFATDETDAKQLALFLRYQTTHDRAFHKCMNDLLKLRAEKRKQEIGFERKKRQEAEQARKQEMHEARLRALQAKSAEQEFENELRQTVEAPLPGHTRIPFEDMKAVIANAIREITHEQQLKQAA